MSDPGGPAPDLTAEVVDFLVKELSVRRSRVTLETTLESLGVTGDDGDYLVIAFAKRFDVDISAFRSDEHFESEGFSMSSLLGFEKKPPRQLRVRDLVRYAQTKVWN